MSKSLKAFILAVFLLTSIFGISQFYTREAYQQQLEASYQRSFRELSVHVHNLELELSKLQVSSWDYPNVNQIANILRLVYAAQANFGQLPLNGLNLSKIENLLAQIQSETVALTKTSLDQERDPKQQFVNLYHQVKYLNQELQQELNQWEREGNWVTWQSYFQTAITNSSKIALNENYPLMQALVMIEDGMDRFSESGFPSELSRLQASPPQAGIIAEQDILDIAQEFLGEIAQSLDLELINQSHSNLGTSTVYGSKEDDSTIVLEIADSGAVLWITNARIVNKSNLSQSELLTIADTFLRERGFSSLEFISVDRFNNRSMFTFTVIEDNTLIYPRHLKVQVAEDNGEIVGFQGENYYRFQKELNHKPGLTAKEAQAYLSDSNNIISHRLAMILDTSYNEILTYEFKVENGGEYYLIYTNASTGTEEKIVRID